MCHVFSPSRAVLSAILRDEYLTPAVRTKEGDKAGSNQPPARDPVQFKLELTPKYWSPYLENTGSRSTRYVSMPHPNESSILPKFIEKSDPEVARPAFSTWPVQKTQPKAFEECTSIQIASNPPISVSRPLVVQNHNPAPHRDVCNFRSSKRKSLVTNQLSAAEFSRVIRRLCVCFDSANRFWSVQNHSTSKDEKETVSFPGEKKSSTAEERFVSYTHTLNF